MNGLWPLMSFVLLQLAIFIGIPTLVLLLVLRHHRRKMADLWLETARQAAVPLSPTSAVAGSRSGAQKTAPRAALARARVALMYPRT
jgi:hypothetical protein